MDGELEARRTDEESEKLLRKGESEKDYTDDECEEDLEEEESRKAPAVKKSEVCLYWSGPRVSDIQDCDGLFDGAITLYGYDRNPKYGDFYGTLKQSLSEKTEEDLFDNPNFCNSSFNIKSGSFNKEKGKCICPARINHNLKSTLEDFFILLHELNVIIEKEKDGTVVRFMTYNPNYVSRYGNCDYIQLLVKLFSDKDRYSGADRDEFLNDENNCLPEYARFGISKDDAGELFDRLVFDYDSNYTDNKDLMVRIEEDRKLFNNAKTLVESCSSVKAAVDIMDADAALIKAAEDFVIASREVDRNLNKALRENHVSRSEKNDIIKKASKRMDCLGRSYSRKFDDYSKEKYCTKTLFKVIDECRGKKGLEAAEKVGRCERLFDRVKKEVQAASRTGPLRRSIETSASPSELGDAIGDDPELIEVMKNAVAQSLKHEGSFDRCFEDIMPQTVCDIILDHMICMNLNEEIMHILDHKDRFRKLCRKLEVGTTEGDLFILPGSFIEKGKLLKDECKKCKKDCEVCTERCGLYTGYVAERDGVFADLKKKVSGSRIVVQEVHSSGGFGTYLIEKTEDLDAINRDLYDAADMRGDENYDKRRTDYIVSKYRFPNVPVNIHAIITNYDIVLLPPSIQNVMALNNKLIYSGADFYAYEKFAENNKVQDSEFKEYTTWICRSIQNHGYRGVIGFDAIVSEKGIEFVEANNRFQASTVLINKALRDQRYLRTKEGFPIRRFDGKKILQGEIIPSVQALNLMAFTDVYAPLEIDGDSLSTRQKIRKKICEKILKTPYGVYTFPNLIWKDNYGICEKVRNKFFRIVYAEPGKGNKDNEDLFPHYSGIINTKVPYSCFIYYEDERSFDKGVARKHYCHMVDRAVKVRSSYENDGVYRTAAVLGPIFEKIVSLSADFDEFLMGYYGDDSVPEYSTGDTFPEIIADILLKQKSGKELRKTKSDIRRLLRLIHSEHISYCSSMEKTILQYCYEPPNPNDPNDPKGKEIITHFKNACAVLRDIVDIHDKYIMMDKSRYNRGTGEGDSSGDITQKMFFGNLSDSMSDSLINKNEMGKRLMREIDRILCAKDCAIDKPVPCGIFDNDIRAETVKREHYCCPGSYAVKLIFARNILSVLKTDVHRDPNVIPPSTKWYELVRSRDILSIKIGLINNGVYFADEREGDEIRKGVNHSVDLRFDTGVAKPDSKENYILDINCECGTPTSEFSPFSVKRGSLENSVEIEYYGELIRISGSYESPIEALENEENRLPNSGIPLSSIAFVATDRVRFQHSDRCRYASIGRGCKFCEFTAEGESTSGNTQYSFGEEEILDGIGKTREVLEKLKEDNHVDHVLIGGGTMFGNPSDVKTRIVKMCGKIRDEFPGKNIYLMCTPPVILSDMDDFKKEGVTEVSFNMEVYDHHLASDYMPGKRSTSTSGYIAALQYATRVWGKDGNVRSALIVGLEDLDSTMEGIRALTSIGVAPILSIFRPTPGTELGWMKPFDSETLYNFYLLADEECGKMKMEFGPKCIRCQNNTLVLPRDLKKKSFADNCGKGVQSP